MLQYIVLALQIVLLAVSWVLFQQAKTELNAKAAEIPVLTEVQALHDRVKQLLVELERTAEREADRVANECSRAETLLAAMHVASMQGVCGPVTPVASTIIDPALAAVHRVTVQPEISTSNPIHQQDDDFLAPSEQDGRVVAVDQEGASVNRSSANPMSRREAILRLAMQGESSADIARSLGVSEGEVETVVGLLRS